MLAAALVVLSPPVFICWWNGLGNAHEPLTTLLAAITIMLRPKPNEPLRRRAIAATTMFSFDSRFLAALTVPMQEPDTPHWETSLP